MGANRAKVLVGMSGGVDSSVAAALLLEQGYDVTGAYMKNWTLDVPGMQCPWAQDLAYAKRTAVRLGIDFVVYDFQDAYKRDVVDYLVAEYQAGRTPNPDIMCNQQVKFGLFLQTALEQGFDYVATGHYAAVEHSGRCSGVGADAVGGPDGACPAPASSAVPGAAETPESPAEAGAPARLSRAADEHKDQTYFLYRVGAEALAHTLFPLGAYTKDQVRALAAERGLPSADKPDSQGICFIGEASIQDFLRQYVAPAPGKIIDADTNQVVGGHEGALFYTLGQRKGLGVGGGQPYFVVGKDMDANVVYVSRNRAAAALEADGVTLQDCTWVAGSAPQPGSYQFRCRHTGALIPGVLEVGDGTGATVRFDGLYERVAPGQSVVVYDGRTCLGGGIAR